MSVCNHKKVEGVLYTGEKKYNTTRLKLHFYRFVFFPFAYQKKHSQSRCVIYRKPQNTIISRYRITRHYTHRVLCYKKKMKVERIIYNIVISSRTAFTNKRVKYTRIYCIYVSNVNTTIIYYYY